MTQDAPGARVRDGLVKRLDEIATWEPADSPRAAAIREAADVLRDMPVRQTDAGRLDDLAFLARGYRIETHHQTKTMRVVFTREPGQKDVLGYMILESPEAYELAASILKDYDRLEGIK